MAPSTFHYVLFGGLAFLGLGTLCYFMFMQKPKLAIKDSKGDKGDSESEKLSKSDDLAPPKAASKAAIAPEVIVEDAEDGDSDDDDDEAAANAELEALKTKYEDANRLATKYISGNAYAKAVEKITEALEIAPKLPNSGKDVTTLYNNRSAMYEKLEMYEKSLTDITVVLSTDPTHLKARVRRARILEVQGKLKQALDDYIFAGLLQQMKQEQPSNQAKVESIVKELARKGAPALFKSLRAAPGPRPLPSKSHCKNFLESYPSMHLWVPHYRAVERSALQQALYEVTASTATDGSVSTPITDATERELQLRQRTLDLVCYDLVHNRFTDAFALLATLPLTPAPAGSGDLDASFPLLFLSAFDDSFRGNPEVLLSLQYELVGFEKHLRCDLTGAIAAYQQALQCYPNNIDARLKLANVYLEVPDLPATVAVFDTLMAHYAQLDKTSEAVAIFAAWTLLHRVSIYVTRNDSGEYSPTAIADAQKDLDEAHALIQPFKGTVAGRAVAVTAYVRSVHVLMQSKPMVGDPTGEDDVENCKKYVEAAKAINPHSESVRLLEAEILNNEGQADEALSIIQAAQRHPDAIPDDCTFYCLRASIMVNKAMILLQSTGDLASAQGLFSEAGSLYLQGKSVEPEAIELLNQYAQFASMMGDIETAVSLIKQALPLARTRDDVQDLHQLQLMNEAQLRAVETLRSKLQQQQ